MISKQLRKAFREKLKSGASQNDIGRESGVDPGKLSRWNRGEGTLSQRKIDALANYLGLTLRRK